MTGVGAKMMTIAILVNNKPVYTRSAVRVKDHPDGTSDYKVDTGEIVQHKPNEGILVLSEKLLKTIKET